MSSETFALEKRFSAFANESIYIPRGYEIEALTTKELQRDYGDKKLTRKDQTIYVDEKAASYLHPDMVNELMQDIPAGIGWFFHLKQCTFLIYGYYGESQEIPIKVYKVDWKKNYQYIYSLLCGNKLKLGITSKHYGITLNAYYPWEKLIHENIAEIVWPIEQQTLFPEIDFEAEGVLPEV